LLLLTATHAVGRPQIAEGAGMETVASVRPAA